jgi:hypothetical protein
VSALTESKTKEFEERNNKALSDLKTEWGDAYEQKMDQAKAGFRDMGFDDSKVEAISAQLGAIASGLSHCFLLISAVVSSSVP